jgi:hypothetical protein
MSEKENTNLEDDSNLENNENEGQTGLDIPT